MSEFGLTIAPLLDIRLIAAMAVTGMIVVLIGLVRHARGALFRLLTLAALTGALINPMFVREQRNPQSDVAVVVVDRTSSQNIGERKHRTDRALERVRQELQKIPDLDVSEVEVFDAVDGDSGDQVADGSNLMTALHRTVGDIPHGRFAGAIMITDGQVHDAAINDAGRGISGPVHVVLSGNRKERDRRLVIDNAPGYGIVGQNVSIAYHVEDAGDEQSGNRNRAPATVTLRDGQQVIARSELPVGKKGIFTFPLKHGGSSILEIAVDPVPGELSELNNHTLISINGIRDRLKVLLVSGYPHAGERTWRNLLKADPAVDLVHFTILRPPEKDDFTPLNELALIAFPVRELFELKLDEFDLVVFDRYILRDILPPSYLQNLADYVSRGGAMLLSVGPEFASTRSLSESPLSKILPAQPTGEILDQAFRPIVSAIGQRHPVTAGLASLAAINRTDPSIPGWGRWFRLVDARTRAGTTVMTGPDQRPLLVLDHVGQGRVALLLSDQIWLWARGYDGGGPQAELLRRLAHWLMKEPDLEEENLRANIKAGELHIQRHSLSDAAVVINVTAPSGETERISTESADFQDGAISLPVTEIGLYKISDGARTVRAASGPLNPLEFADLRTTANRMAPVVEKSGGGMFWYVDGLPDLRRVLPDRNAHGRGWAGFVENRSYIVTGVLQAPLSPALVLIVLLLLMSAWWREGRS